MYNSYAKGFTLIELILYVAISAVILVSVSVFLHFIFVSKIKNQTVAEVELQGQQAMHVILQTIRNARDILSPTTGTDATLLSLATLNTATTPTIFTMNGESLGIQEGVGASSLLTSPRVRISQLTFFNLSKPNTFGTVRVRFTVTHVNPGGANEYNYQSTFYGSASLRQ